MTVREYIKANWKVFRDEGGVIPFPYTPPCFEDGAFTVLYYWDTFFTNEGLIADGRIQDAKNNVDNLIYFLNKFGCVPNMTRENGADYASQPPLLYLMINRLSQYLDDDKWLENAYISLEKEYWFWMSERLTPCGLNRYGTNKRSKIELARFYDNAVLNGRIKLKPIKSFDKKVEQEKSLIAEGESGEDHTPRFFHKAYDYAAIDLNSHLYGVEISLSNYFNGKDDFKSEYYKKQSKKRLKLMDKYMRDANGVYHDYNYKTKQQSKIYACACFVPYFLGIATDGVEILLEKLDVGSGLSACEDVGENDCQWGYPYIWPPHQYFAFEGAKKAKKTSLAIKYAKNFLNLVEKTFKETGVLWERYCPNGVAPDLEYKTQIMLGWTAGVYNHLFDALIAN